ncbi:formate dehydrogenase subunit gamma [Chloroflexota bacterium]
MTEERVIERFKKRTIWLHWIHTAAFLILVITGAILFIPGLGSPAAGGITRLLHRIAVVFFVGVPVLYTFIDPAMALRFMKESFTWGKDDLKWVSKAPDYYFGGDEEKMLPQGHINTGQKMWQFIILATSVVFVITGIIMWFLKGIVAPGIFQWCVICHDVVFVIVFLMLLVHIYLGVIHPRMTESFRSMVDGKISKKYAKSHYGNWYDEIDTEKEK